MTHEEFKRRFMPLQQMLYREAYRMLGDRFEAEDAVQNLYVRLWEQKERLDNLVSPKEYCLRALKNICIDRWRRMRTRDEEVDFVEEISEANAPPDTEREEAEEFVEHFLATLPERQQRVMTMQIQGNSIEEIAEVTELTEGNVKVMLSRIRKRFRELYYKR
ncbi:MAG: sigma-70 family RNA polymerase sigma factor [Bacteroidaceae bacterium]|nr:sigma-70 family RNA polymerase sigma factor [Bacteroidaceae bacterium]